MDSQSLRLRLVFEDRSILSQAQRSEGMNRSWLLIDPKQLPKISDLCSHLLNIFDLNRSCPNGLFLSMEGFVLPPFESTLIFKDKEIVCVERKGGTLTDTIGAADGCNLLDNVEINNRENVDNGVLLLANEEFEKETGGYRSESEEVEEEQSEDEPSPEVAVSKKRKASTKLQRLKKKKHCLGVKDGAENEAVTGEIDNVNNHESLPRKISKKEKTKPSDKSNKGSSETSNEKVESLRNVKRSQHLQENVEDVKQASAAPDGVKKAPSRSARRKKAKRQWLRELAKISKKKPDSSLRSALAETGDQEADSSPKEHLDSPVKSDTAKTENQEANGSVKRHLQQKQASQKPRHKNNNMIEKEENNHNDDVNTEVVPIVVRPGHIRFEPVDEDEAAKQTEVSNETFQWNGITSKKKGQKWGTEKFSSSRRNISQKTSEESSKMLTPDTDLPVIDANKFDNLPPCSLPKEGDVIAYRLIELSSTWTPELSSFRVGRVSSYDGTNIVLTPVPEYPIVSDKTDEAADNSLYREDGVLDIKFQSLLDVRNVKQSNSDAAETGRNSVNQTSQGNDQDLAPNLAPTSNNNKANVPNDSNPVVEKKEGNPWDEVSEALNAKKSELLELEEAIKRDSGRNPWSYRALRGSALGPTMAMLRSKNTI